MMPSLNGRRSERGLFSTRSEEGGIFLKYEFSKVRDCLLSFVISALVPPDYWCHYSLLMSCPVGSAILGWNGCRDGHTGGHSDGHNRCKMDTVRDTVDARFRNWRPAPAAPNDKNPLPAALREDFMKCGVGGI